MGHETFRPSCAGPPAAPGEAADAVAIVSTDELVSESVLAQLRDHPAVKFAKSVEFRA